MEPEFEPDAYDLQKTAKFFIKHLLSAKKYSNYYSQKNISFTTVFLYATFTAITTQKDKTILTVDDGTASINCMIDDNQSSILLEKNNTSIDDLQQKILQNKDDALLAGSLILLKSSNRLLNNVAYKNFQLGDNVKIIGKLREYRESRYIFVTHLEKRKDLDNYTQYLSNIIYLYENIYPNFEEEI